METLLLNRQRKALGPSDDHIAPPPFQASALGWTLGTFAVVGTSGVVIALLDSNQAPAAGRESLILAVILTVYCGVRLSVIIAEGKVRPLSAAFWLFGFTAMAFAPLVQIVLGQFPPLQEPDLLAPALWLVLIGLAGWEAGYQLGWSNRALPHRMRDLDMRRLVTLGAIGTLGSINYIRSVGPSTLFESRDDLSNALVQGGLTVNGSNAITGIILSLGQVPVFVTFTFLTCVLMVDKHRRRIFSFQAGWLFMLAVNVLVNNPISNSRNWFITVALGLLLALPRLRASTFRLSLFAGVFAAIVAFPISDYFRRAAGSRQPFEIGSVLQTITQKDYDQTTMIANGIWWVSTRGSHTFGGQLLGAVLFFLPRSTWPGKPIDTGIEIGRALHSANTNLSSPLWIEFWVDFGTAGVVIGFLFLGWLARRADDLFLWSRERHGQRVLVADVAIPVFAAAEFIVIRGPLLQAMSRVVVLALVFWFLRSSKISENGSAISGECQAPSLEPTAK